MVYSTGQRVFLVATYTKKKSFKTCRRKFHRKYPAATVPSKSMILRLVKKFRSTGSVLDMKKHRKCSVLTEEKIGDIGTLLEGNPRKSVARLAAQSGVSVGSFCKAKKLLKLRHCRITKVDELSISRDCSIKTVQPPVETPASEVTIKSESVSSEDSDVEQTDIADGLQTHIEISGTQFLEQPVASESEVFDQISGPSETNISEMRRAEDTTSRMSEKGKGINGTNLC